MGATAKARAGVPGWALDYHVWGACASEKEFAEAVRARTNAEAWARAGAMRVVIHIAQADDRVLGRVEIRDGEQGVVERSVDGATCREVGDALALIVALAIERGIVPVDASDHHVGGGDGTAGPGDPELQRRSSTPPNNPNLAGGPRSSSDSTASSRVTEHPDALPPSHGGADSSSPSQSSRASRLSNPSAHLSPEPSNSSESAHPSPEPPNPSEPANHPSPEPANPSPQPLKPLPSMEGVVRKDPDLPRWVGGVQGDVQSGVAPWAALGGHLFVERAWGQSAVRFSAGYVPETAGTLADPTPGVASFSLLWARTEGCPLGWRSATGLLRAHMCGTLGLGLLRAAGRPAALHSEQNQGETVWGSLGVVARVGWHIGGMWWMEGQGQLLVPLARARFEFEVDGVAREAYAAPLVAAGAGLGVACHFR